MRLFTLGLCLWAAGCRFDPSGIRVPREQGMAGDGPADLAPPTDHVVVLVDSRPLDVPGAEQAPGCAGMSCPLGCNGAENRCFRIKPTGHDVSTYHDAITGQVNGAVGDLTVNTSSGEIRAGPAWVRPGGGMGAVVNGIYWNVLAPRSGYPEVSVFGMASLDLPQGRTITVVGERALAIYAKGTVNIAGKLLAGAVQSSPGPGGAAGGAKNGAPGVPCLTGEGQGGAEAGSDASQIEAGGGGGGHGSTGGKGGDCSSYSNGAPGGAGGKAVGATTLWPLRGGCGGGAGGGPDSWVPGDGGYGGGGGGAIQITVGGTLRISGEVSAPGAGGEGGHYGAGGGGGGAGGAILLEALTINLSGVVAANGGGGGSGGGSTNVASAPDGQAGQPSAQPAAGAPGSAPHGGPGGAGGAKASPAGAPGGEQANGGGGGGAVGVVAINAKGASITGIVSPSPITGQPATW